MIEKRAIHIYDRLFYFKLLRENIARLQSIDVCMVLKLCCDKLLVEIFSLTLLLSGSRDSEPNSESRRSILNNPASVLTEYY